MRVLIKIQSSLKFMPVCAEISSHSNVSSELQTNSMRVSHQNMAMKPFPCESLCNSTRSTRTAEIIVGEPFLPTVLSWSQPNVHDSSFVAILSPATSSSFSFHSALSNFLWFQPARAFLCCVLFSKWFIFDYSCTLRDHVDWFVWNWSLSTSGWCLLTSMSDSPPQLIKTKLLRNFERLRLSAGNDNCQFSRLLLPREKKLKVRPSRLPVFIVADFLHHGSRAHH